MCIPTAIAGFAAGLTLAALALVGFGIRRAVAARK